MYKMHESQQKNRANHSTMSQDSMNSSLSKISTKKSSFYKHEDPAKLNYYARFSPNRKKIDEEFESFVREGESPLSPRSRKSSSRIKKSVRTQRSKIKKGERIEDDQHEKFQLIDEGLLLYINQKQQIRNEIYIDEGQQAQETPEYNERDPIIKKLFPNSSQLTQISPEPIYLQNQLSINGYKTESNNQPSESQQSSSFERMIEPSSSDENQIIYVPKVSTGFQMRIEDDNDSQEESESHHPKQIKPSSDHVLVYEGSEQKIFELAKSIGSVKVDKKSSSENREVKSENVSFSIDSDLSMIEEKWNSYFEASHDDESSKNDIEEKQPLFGENVSEIGHNQGEEQNNEINQRKLSQSSDYELPSFSNPNSSNYVTPQSSHHESLIEPQDNEENQKNENEKKEFKRQYTFGNELNTAFSNEESEEAKVQTQKSVPLFMKFMSKETIAGFSKSKVLNTKKTAKNVKKQQSKTQIIQKQKVPKNLLSKFNPAKHNTKETENDQKQQSETLEVKQNQFFVDLKSFDSGQILIEEDPNQSDSSNEEQNNKSSTQNVTSQIRPDIIIEINSSSKPQTSFYVENVKRQDFQTAKLYEKAKKRALWKKNMHTMLQKERNNKRKESELVSQNSQKIENQVSEVLSSDLPEIKVEDELFQEPFKPQQQQRYPKNQQIPKHEQLTGYAKIYSKKRLNIGKAKTQTYQQKIKSNSSHYQSSQKEDSASQDANENHPKDSERQSLTTATQEITHNLYYQSYSSPKRRSNGIEEVENLKKYLKKIEDSSKNDVKKQLVQVKFETNQSLQELETERSSLPENIDENKHKDSKELDNKLTPQNFNSQKQVKNLEEIKRQTVKLSHPQNHKFALKEVESIGITLVSQPKQTQTFAKSLEMLENLIPSLPHQLIPVYEKIYTQVYQQQLKYQKRIEKQSFLLNFMEHFLKGQKEKIDCEGFLSCDSYPFDCSDRSLFTQNEEELQIFINKHIILALVRKLASNS